MTLTKDGDQVSTGSGAACLGDPLAAVAWLAATASRLGTPLRAGDVVLSGALGPMVSVAPGEELVADLGVLGVVRCRFGELSS
jgi:2-keto-4-pentenoate hydratase